MFSEENGASPGEGPKSMMEGENDILFVPGGKTKAEKSNFESDIEGIRVPGETRNL